jgi:hypothetical protein
LHDVRCRSWNPVPVNPITQHAEVKCLEEDQADQDDDRDPNDRVSKDDSVPEPAVRQQSVVLHQRAAVHVVGHHGASPELIREVDGSRIAAVSLFSKALRRQ